MKTSFVPALRDVASWGVAFLIAMTIASVAMAGDISLDTVTGYADTLKTAMASFVVIIIGAALCYALWHAFNHGIGTGIAAVIFVVCVAGLIYEAIA